MGIFLDKASLIALFLETLFYGVFLTLYLLTLLILLKKTGVQRILLIPVATLLLCTTTAHLIVDFVRALEAFVFKTDSIDANAYYSNFSSPLELAKIAIYVTQTTLADGLIVWRCYMIHDKSPLVAFPGCIVLLTNGAIGYYIVWSLSMTTAVSTTSDKCITTFITLTMVIGVTCTTLIAWRIYRTRRFMPGGLGVFLPVLIVIVESGALYATSALAFLLAFLLGSNGQYTILDVIPPIVGIAFCLIVLQTHFHVGGKPPIEQPSEGPDILIGLF
ncbi:hypothetical protein DEU56DRAFT_733267 [Suillus clintonianus]|uniref:uncharacterized protein n=1 Tax=Suillus clintonianus TaxID=1904413 RepID=UPI001B86B292|nr:uncharacterized protein DEU56DRAFT_733267 [Suillus clintonianus]KAG2143090.1 hypothetical protein DEU56DRAFT_733267 [Suillus clintonianus]